MPPSSKAEFELVPKSEMFSFAVREFRLPAFQSPWHFHPECELTYIARGTGKRYVGDSIASFGPGDLVLIGSNLPHYWRSDIPARSRSQHAHSLVIQFREEFLGPDSLSRPEMQSIRKLLGRARRGLLFAGSAPEKVRKLILQLQGAEGLGRLIGLLQIFQLLAESKQITPLSSPGFSPDLDEFASTRINRVYQFIFENFARPIDHQEVARNLGMSLSAFSHYFKRVTGHTLSGFINEVRIGHARKLLIDTDQSVAEIAFASGYETLSHFNRRFHTLTGVSPKAYRRQHSRA